MIKSFLLPIFSMLLILVSCSQSKQSDTNLVVSVSNLLGDITFTGGATLRLINSTTGEVIDNDLVPPYKMLIPHGTWDLYLIGFDGPSAWEAPQRCGSLLKEDFYDASKTITIYVNSTNCAPEPFFSIITEKSATNMPVAQWGSSSNWGEAKWGP